MKHTVVADVTLGACLVALYPDSSGRTRKQLLETGRVRVNDRPAKTPQLSLRAGDVVEIGEPRPRSSLPRGLDLLHEDDDLLVIVKAPNLLTIATERERERTAYAWLSAHVKERRASAKVFVVHRLDKPASGLLVFAKSPRAKHALQAQFEAHSVERAYAVVVEGRIEQQDGVIRSRLVEDATGRVRETQVPNRGREAITHFRVVLVGSASTLLEVKLETGRKNQIRVHLAGLGHPIVGDEAYGSRLNPIGRLALHARTLGFVHPRTGEPLRFESPVPRSFHRIDELLGAAISTHPRRPSGRKSSKPKPSGT